MRDAPRASRLLVHEFDGVEHIDWRWEYLENALAKVVVLFDIIKLYFTIAGLGV